MSVSDKTSVSGKTSVKSNAITTQPTRKSKKELSPVSSVYAQPGQQFGQKYIRSPNTPGYTGRGIPLIAPVFEPPPPIPGVPVGLEYMIPLDHVFVKQQTELLNAFANVEAANHYSVLAGQGQRIYLASETTGCCSLCCCGSSRPFTIDIADVFGRPVLHIERPWDSTLFLTTHFLCCCGQIGGRVIVTLPDGTKYGEIIHQFHSCRPKYIITDGAGTHLMNVGGAKCGDCCGICCCNVDFPITSADGSQEIGCIRKSFSGVAQELFTDADNFGVEFPLNYDIQWKALMLAAVFLIDYMYFEKSSQDKPIEGDESAATTA